MEYLYIDNTSKNKSVASFNGGTYEFYYGLFNVYTQQEVEAFIKAEILLAQGDVQAAVNEAQPFISGENTFVIEDVEVDGILTTVSNGSDTRSLLKKWYDEKNI